MGVDDLRAVWERLGEDDPLWAVLSDPARKGGGWDLGEFMATGVDHVQMVRNLVAEHGLSLGDRVLDFGCGVGRLSQVLAAHVPAVVGLDIAASMIDTAKRLNRYPDRVEYVNFDGRLLPFGDNGFDSAVSLMVLQHAPPPVQLMTLLELNRVVRPGGVIVVQVPNVLHASQPLAPEACHAEIVVLEAPITMPSGSTALVRARVVNRGDLGWPAGQAVKLGNHWFAGDTVVVPDDARADLPHQIEPGESVDLDLRVRAPDEPGEYEIELDMVQEFVAWWAELGSTPVRLVVRVSSDHAANAQQNPKIARPVAPRSDYAMHTLPISLVQSLFQHVGSTIVSDDTDGFAGAEWDSRTCVVQVGAA